jgi:predicted RNA binding protein YcfA (HicA-like mRNA interferase family)
MGSVPVLKPAEVCRLLTHLGFGLVRQRGSHAQYRHPDGRGTTVPMHKGRDIVVAVCKDRHCCGKSPGTLASPLKN